MPIFIGMNKICSSCKKSKDISEFSLRSKKWIEHRSGIGLYAAKCKECHKEYVKNHYHRNKEHYLEKYHEFKRSNRLKMYEYLSDKQCIDCGENDPVVLDFDHKDKETKERGIAEMLRKNAWETILKEIEKCDIRCSNCHRRRTAKQFGYTKYLLQKHIKHMKYSFGKSIAAQKLELLLQDNPSARRKITQLISRYTEQLLLVVGIQEPRTVRLCMEFLRDYNLKRIDIITNLTEDMRSYARNVVIGRYRVYYQEFNQLAPIAEKILQQERSLLTSKKRRV